MNKPNENITALRTARPRGHAEISPPRRRWLTRVFLPAAILLAAAALLVYTSRDTLRPAVEVQIVRAVGKPPAVGVDQSSANITRATNAAEPVVRTREIIQAPGWVEPDPFPTYVSALTPGVIEEVLVLEGETVKKDQIVARMVADDAKLEMARAEAALQVSIAKEKAAQANLTAAETDWDNPIERDLAIAVAAAHLDEAKAELKKLSATIDQQTAKRDELRVIFERAVELNKTGSTTKFEIDQATYQLQAQAAVLQATLDERAIINSLTEGYEAQLLAAKENRRLRVTEKQALDLAEADLADARAQVKIAQTAVDTAALKLSRMEVRSPATGVVMTRLASPGAKLMLDMDSPHSAHVVHLYDPNKLQVRVDIPLADAAKVSVGQRAKIIVEVLPDREFDGVVTRIVHEADIQKNTQQVKVAIENPSTALKPEMLARAKFLPMGRGGRSDRGGSDSSGNSVIDAPTSDVSESSLRVYVPTQSLRDRAADRAAVWIVNRADNIAERRDVELAQAEGDWTMVRSGVNAGDSVIVSPLDKLAAGRRVRIARGTTQEMK